MLDFYRSIEKKRVYEAEDMVLERFGSSDGDALAGAMKRLPYRTTLSLGTRPVLPQDLPSMGASNPVFERTIVCTKRFGKPMDYSGDGVPFYGVNVACDAWHVQAAEARGIALAAKPPALPGPSKEQANLMKQCLRWETDPADVEYTVDSYRQHSFADMLDKEAEVVNFGQRRRATPQRSARG